MRRTLILNWKWTKMKWTKKERTGTKWLNQQSIESGEVLFRVILTLSSFFVSLSLTKAKKMKAGKVRKKKIWRRRRSLKANKTSESFKFYYRKFQTSSLKFLKDAFPFQIIKVLLQRWKDYLICSTNKLMQLLVGLSTKLSFLTLKNPQRQLLSSS